MDRAWIDKWLSALEIELALESAVGQRFFEPSTMFYDRLKGGDEIQLQHAADLIAVYLRLSPPPLVGFEWSVRMEPGTAGQIRYQANKPNTVRIPFAYAGKPLPLGGILAHELTHDVLWRRNMTFASIREFEQVTDLASIYLGLGKLVLNGIATEVGILTGVYRPLGYVSPELKVYAYAKVAKKRRIVDEDLVTSLSDKALNLLKKHA